MRIFKKRDGFTMGELIVAMSLFIIVITIASGTFVTSIRSQRDIVTSTSVNSNVTQALERMAREMRTGLDFGGTTASRANFTNAKNEEVNYKISGYSIVRCVGSDPSCEYIPITADKIKINALKFTYSGASPARITITIEVQGIRETVVSFQTTVSPRTI